MLALLARDAATEMSNLEYLLAQPITPTAKLKLHIAGIIRAYYRFPYMNRLIHYLLHESSRRLRRRGLESSSSRRCWISIAACSPRASSRGEFRATDPVLFYTSLIGACDHLFFGRHAMSRATGVGPVTDDVCRQYIKHMETLICGGILTQAEEAAAAG